MLALLALALTQTACSDRDFNPYLSRNEHRNIGQTVQAASEAPDDAISTFDFRMEKAVY
jgi:hypothetical protein